MKKVVDYRKEFSFLRHVCNQNHAKNKGALLRLWCNFGLSGGHFGSILTSRWYILASFWPSRSHLGDILATCFGPRRGDAKHPNINYYIYCFYLRGGVFEQVFDTLLTSLRSRGRLKQLWNSSKSIGSGSGVNFL